MFYFFKQTNFIDKPERVETIFRGIDKTLVNALVPALIIPLKPLNKPLNKLPKELDAVEVWHKTSGAEKPINKVTNKSLILFSNFIFNAFSNYD